ncbi:MAG: GHMP kinase [Chloroflexi bacterium]|nr:MAG: GHMP kinase [Chloroflexota bacterium]
MIITQTPLRISFLGGGTDFRAYFRQEAGWVLTSAIDKYIYVTIKKRFDQKIRVGYSQTELVDHIDELHHELVRECLRKTGITRGVEISTMADIPSEGSGLGSSSTVTVGLLNAMYTYIGTPVGHEQLAREACEIEIDVLGKPIGVQDQYIAAYGGQRFICFNQDDSVTVEHLKLEDRQRRKLSQNLLLFYTNIARKAESVLTEQVQKMDERLHVLREMKKLALQAKACLQAGEFDELGCLLDQSWQMKKQLASGVSNTFIDEIYAAACKAGALGGKITGAGGGGFLLLYCPLEKQERVRAALSSLPELPFRLEHDGSKVIFHYRRE